MPLVTDWLSLVSAEAGGPIPPFDTLRTSRTCRRTAKTTSPSHNPTPHAAGIYQGRRALYAIVCDRLIAAEAGTRQVREQEVIDGEIESNVQIPSDEDVERFYEAHKARISFPRDEALRWVRHHMTALSRKRLRDLFVRNVRRSHGVKVYLEPVRYEVAAANHPSRGPADAPVTIVEFSD